MFTEKHFDIKWHHTWLYYLGLKDLGEDDDYDEDNVDNVR